MRASQLWHWIYHRGAREFAAMRNIARPVLDRLARALHPRAARSRRRTDLRRRHPQVAAAHGPCSPLRQGRRDRMRLYPGVRSRHALRLEPGRLHPQLLVLPHRHDAAGAQPDGGRDRRPGPRRPRPARRFSRRRCSGRRARAQGRGRPRGVQHRLHGHGRAALQFRGGARRDRDSDRRRRPVAVEAAHHRLDLRGRARDGEAWGRMRDDARGVAARDQQCAARQARAAQPEISARDAASRPAATIRAPPTPGASRSNT